MTKQLKMNIESLAIDIIEIDYLLQLYIQIKSSNIKKVNRYNYFFSTILSTIQYTVFIKISKIVLYNEEKNIYKLIERCRHEIDNYSYDEKLSDEMNKFELDLKKITPLILKIKTLRDKFLVHSDSKYFYDNNKAFYDAKINGESLEDLVKILYDHICKMCEIVNITLDKSIKENIINDFNNILNLW